MYSENPLCEQRNTYSPGGSCSTRYAPPDCAFTVLGCISVGPETSIVAPSSVAPDGSEAIPVMRPVMATCAITVEPGSRDRSSRSKKRTCRMAGISLCGVPRHWGRGAVKGQTPSTDAPVPGSRERPKTKTKKLSALTQNAENLKTWQHR